MAVYAIPSGQFWEADVAAKFVHDLEALDPAASGLAMNHHTHSLMIKEGFRNASGYAVGLILLVLLFDFRSARDFATLYFGRSLWEY